MDLIGLEGSFPDDAPVTWASAALSDGAHLVNPTTGSRAPIGELDHLVAEGHVTKLATPLHLRAGAEAHPLVVVAIRKQAPYAAFLLVDVGGLGGVVETRSTNVEQLYVLEDESAFRNYASQVAEKILNRLLDDDAADIRAPLIRYALILNPHDPYVNAMQVFIAGLGESARRLAKASLKGADDLNRFNLLLSALGHEGGDYHLHYERGAAQGGGLDIDVAAETFGSLQAIHREVAPAVVREFPFVGRDIPAPRFRAMEARSADMSFAAAIPGRSLRERVARYLELRFMEQVLRGDAGSPVARTRSLDTAVRKVITPAPDTSLSLRPFGSQVDEPVSQQDDIEGVADRSDPLVLLAFQSGLVNEAGRIEITVAPGSRLMIPTDRDADGHAPQGIDYLRNEGNFLFRPALFTLVREVRLTGEANFWLSSVVFLDEGRDEAITAMPSSIVRDAFLYGLDIRARRTSRDEIHTVVGEIKAIRSPSLNNAKAWLTKWMKLCADFEVQHAAAGAVTWLPSPKPLQPTALERVLLVLYAAGGAAEVQTLVNRIFERFGRRVRINNTRREVINNPALLAFDADNNQVMKLTERGYAQAKILDAAGRFASSEP